MAHQKGQQSTRVAEIPVTWPELLNEFEVLNSTGGVWFYRGHSCASWPLQTSLERHTPSGMRPSDAEAVLLREFRRRAHIYLRHEDMPTPVGEWLALMQHFGSPTRLLDVSRSPYVATYFAVEQPPEVEESAASDSDDVVLVEQPCAVWAINQHWCQQRSGHAFMAADPAWMSLLESKVPGVTSAGLEPETLEVIAGSLSRVDLTSSELPTGPLRPAISVYEPERLSQRLAIQQGAFLVPSDPDLSFEENLRALGDLKDEWGIRKLVLHASQRPRALEQLRLMNITRESLFPGFEGFAQSFRQLLIKEPSDAKRDRLVKQMNRKAILGLMRASEETHAEAESGDGEE